MNWAIFNVMTQWACQRDTTDWRRATDWHFDLGRFLSAALKIY